MIFILEHTLNACKKRQLLAGKVGSKFSRIESKMQASMAPKSKPDQTTTDSDIHR